MRPETLRKLAEGKAQRRTTPLKPREFVRPAVTVTDGCGNEYVYLTPAAFKRRSLG
jgi:hypothetical protein